MNILLRNIALIILLVSTPSAWSLEATQPSPVTSATAFSAYWGLGFNSSNFSMNQTGILSTFPSLTANVSTQSNSSNMFGFMGYRFDEFLAMQADFIGGGSIRVNDNGVNKKLFDPILFTVSAVLNKPVSNNLDVFGKLGGTFWTLSQPLTSSQSLTVDNGFGLSFGAGIDFNLYGSKERMLRLEWNHYKMDDVLIKSADSLTLGAVFNF